MNIGYGEYLVTATSLVPWASQDVNLTFGAFTYQRDPGSELNPHRELDTIEISKWGNPSNPNNSQFTVQPWFGDSPQNNKCDAGNSQCWNEHPFNVDPNLFTVTAYMNWKGSQQPVEFRLYKGQVSIDDIRQDVQSNNNPQLIQKWNTTDSTNNSTNKYIPSDDDETNDGDNNNLCIRYHLNFYMGAGDNNSRQPPSDNQPHSVTVTNFQYYPANTAVTAKKSLIIKPKYK